MYTIAKADTAKGETGTADTHKKDMYKRHVGAQANNRNSLRHGMYGTGKLPKELRFIENRLNGFRRLVEDTVLAEKGVINLTDASLINTAMKWERHAALAQRWLTVNYKKLKPQELLNFSREVARGSMERDKCILALSLGTKVDKPWLLASTSEGGAQ